MELLGVPINKGTINDLIFRWAYPVFVPLLGFRTTEIYSVRIKNGSFGCNICYPCEGATSYIFMKEEGISLDTAYSRFFLLHEVGHAIYSGNYTRVQRKQRMEMVISFILLFSLQNFSLLIEIPIISFILSLLVIMFYVYKHSPGGHENYADIFALINLTRQDRAEILKALQKYPDFFKDSSDHMSSSNKSRLETLSKIIEMLQSPKANPYEVQAKFAPAQLSDLFSKSLRRSTLIFLILSSSTIVFFIMSFTISIDNNYYALIGSLIYFTLLNLFINHDNKQKYKVIRKKLKELTF